MFKVVPGQGSAFFTKLHNFVSNNTDGGSPAGGLVMDNAGNLYGTTYVGGDFNSGTAYKVTP